MLQEFLVLVAWRGPTSLGPILGCKAFLSISARTLTGWAHGIVGSEIEGFQLKRIRSAVETLLAREGVSRERGHLQSHGLTGVQSRHYDGHDYIPEKRNALKVLAELICVAGSIGNTDIAEMVR